jgi:hypothetical protein
MDSLHQKCILDISKIAERCVAGYETLYRRTKLSIGDDNSFSVKGMGDRSSDTDDETTDVSGENLSSSPELCPSSEQYYVLSGTKPFSLVIRRCSTPTTENNSPFLKRDSSVSSPFTKEFERTSEIEILNSDRKVNDSFVHQQAIVPCNCINSNVEESDDVLGQTVSGGTVRSLQKVILNTSNESSDSVVTQECIENILYANAVHVEVCTIPSGENGVHFNYTGNSALLPSKPVFENCCDSTDGNCSLPLCCSRERYRRVKNDSIDNRNQYLSHPLGNPKNAQPLMQMLPSEHSKQEVELPIYNSVLEVQGEESNVGITKGGECQETQAVDSIRHEVKSSADVILETDSFHVREHTESAEKMAILNVQSEFVVEGESNLKSSIIKASLNEVCEGDGIAAVDDSLKFENGALSLLEIQGGNASELDKQAEGCNEVRAILCHDVEVTVDRNLFDEEDHVVCAGKQDEWKKTEVISDVSKDAVQNDTVKSELEIEIGCEPVLTQETDYTSEEIKMNMLHNPSVLNRMRNASEIMSLMSVGCRKSPTKVENSGNSSPVIYTENVQTLPVEDDNFVQKCVECPCDDGEGLKTVSNFSLTVGPRSLGPSKGMDGVVITDQIAQDESVSVKAEVIVNSVCNSELAGSMTVGGAYCCVDKFCTTSKADHLQSQSSVRVQLCSENVSDTVHTELSPLLFSSDDDNSYYTGKLISGMGI